MIRPVILAAAAAALLMLPGAACAQGGARVAQAFKKMDANGDGVITLDEWTNAGRKEAGFRRIDANGDGKITLQELQAALAQARSR
jgi:Ca2+-binding EF-hand superfamily protein